MKKFSKFYFKSFEFNKSNMQAKFHYCFDNDIFFEEMIDFKNYNFNINIRDDFDTEILNNILFNIHIAFWISYYKSFPTKELIVESWFLDEYQTEFWKKFYINWLGEFLYTNKISPDWLFNFINKSDIKYIKKDFNVWNKALIPVWGWKDSIVSIELLKKAWIDFDLFVFWKEDKLKNNTSEISSRDILLVKRIISKNLIKFINDWYYNWHVPITWLIAFVMEAVAYIYNYKYLVLSNEKSANFWNTLRNWININHQYSKSLEFETDFKKYVEKYISSDVKYFSLLRGMYEVKIAKYFSKYAKKYFSKFSSCNNNFKIFNKSDKLINWQYWCNNCPKCAFVFSILRPYLSNNEIIEIFGEDLYKRKDLELLFRELLWITWIKPFECVWESEEVIYSMYKSLDKYKNKLPYILEIFNNEVLIKFNKNNLTNIEKKLWNIFSQDIIPEEIKKIVFKDKI